MDSALGTFLDAALGGEVEWDGDRDMVNEKSVSLI